MDFQPLLICLATEKSFSPTTVRAYASDMAIFSRFLDSCGKSTAAEVARTGIATSLKNSSIVQLAASGGRVSAMRPSLGAWQWSLAFLITKLHWIAEWR
jgi:hypothetical protein